MPIQTKIKQSCNVSFVIWVKLGFWCLTPFSTIFQLYRGGPFHWWRKQDNPEKNHQSGASHWQTLSHNSCIEYTSPSAGFEHTTLVVKFVIWFMRISDLLFTMYSKVFYLTEWYRLVFWWPFIWWLVTLLAKESCSKDSFESEILYFHMIMIIYSKISLLTEQLIEYHGTITAMTINKNLHSWRNLNVLSTRNKHNYW